MFQSENLPVLLKSVTLKQNEDRERFAYCKFMLEPFIPRLAHELGEEVFGHLFDAMDTPRREVSDISFDLTIPSQSMTSRSHPELEADAMISDVRFDSVRVTRPDSDKPRLRLEFVCIVPLLDRMVIEFVVQSFGNPLYLTFQAMQGSFLDAHDNLLAGGLSSISVDGKTLVEFSEDEQQAAKKRVAGRSH